MIGEGDECGPPLEGERTRAEVMLPVPRNPPEPPGGPAHRELWINVLDGYTVIASSDGEAATISKRRGVTGALATRASVFPLRGASLLLAGPS
jgi:hypothetical protein